MKIKEGFILRPFVNQWVAIPVGKSSAKGDALVTLNEVGAYLWELLQQERTKQEMMQQILNTYDVDEATAEKDLGAFLQKLETAGLLQL